LDVKQGCRYCECLSTQLGSSKSGNYSLRTPAHTTALIERNDKAALKNLSQACVSSALNDLTFGFHSKRGIHGATPAEILHTVHLGTMKRIIASFFDQAGRESKPCAAFDVMCISVSSLLKHQSDRDVPRFSFSRGFSKGTNLTANEYPGVILVMLFAMECTKYQSIFLPGGKYQNTLYSFREEWIELFESLLEWERWLNLDTITRKQVKQSQKGVRWLMRRIKFTAPRNKGCGHNTIKFHLPLHFSKDIMDYGVPKTVHSGVTEKNHITMVKRTAARTQRRKATLALQTGERYVENVAISRAWATLGKTKSPSSAADPKNNDHQRQGRLYHIQGNGKIKWLGRGTKDLSENAQLPNRWIQFLTKHCIPKLNNTGSFVECSTEFCWQNQIFRAHPYYHTREWFDIVMIDWGEGIGYLPAQICCFVNMSSLRHGESIFVNESYVSEPGLYALVESMSYVNGDDVANNSSSRLIARVRKDLDQLGNPIPLLVHTASITRPTIAIPDLGGLPHNYLLLQKCRGEWAESWGTFISQLAEEDVEETDSEEEEEEEDEQDEQEVLGEVAVHHEPTKKQRQL